jgi:hypothetical protein
VLVSVSRSIRLSGSGLLENKLSNPGHEEEETGALD